MNPILTPLQLLGSPLEIFTTGFYNFFPKYMSDNPKQDSYSLFMTLYKFLTLAISQYTGSTPT